MSSETEDPTDLPGSTAEPTPEPAIEESLDAWSKPTSEQTWTPIDVDGENPGAPAVEPAGAPAVEPAATGSPVPESTAAAEAKLSPWQSIAAEQDAIPRPAPTHVDPAGRNPYASVAGSEAAAGKTGGLKRPSSLRAALDERLASVPRRPLSPPPPLTGSPRVSASGAEAVPPAGDGPSGPSLPERLFALTNERPELGLGIAFAGGLVLATIIKRLGRR